MDCIAIFSSGNYAFNLCRILERKGYIFEVVSTPCQIAKDGCGYCLRFPVQYRDMVLMESVANRTPVREMYRIIPAFSKNRYERVY